MKKILVLGAGRSSTTLIQYLLDHSFNNKWKIVLGDISEELALQKIKDHPNGKAVCFNIRDRKLRQQLIEDTDLVISMLPQRMHYPVALGCLKFRKHMITASYVSPKIKRLDKEVKKHDLLFLNEIGLDPGIDHMSAMRIIDRIRSQGGKITVFDSSTGGLIAPESDNNPWHYKFTWNPRNVILAGQDGARFLYNCRFKHIPYHKLFQRIETVKIQDMGNFEIYPNRDSLKYQSIYDMFDIKTMFRGTIRRSGFCAAWDVFVQLGLTDDTYLVEQAKNMTYRDFINIYLKYHKHLPVEKKLAAYLGIKENSEVMNKDMIVMLHRIKYILNGEKNNIWTILVVIGSDPENTAMAKTVGLPVGIAAKLILEDRISARGIQIPLLKEIYEPVLNELEEHGIRFIEEDREFDV
jgi:saccharopine dehydrogenase-like NADP-dependent oxidoreductase